MELSCDGRCNNPRRHGMTKDLVDDAIRFYRALNNIQRLRIVGALAGEWSSASGLARALHLSEDDVRQHLEKLRELGALEGNDVGESCTIDVRRLRAFGKALDDIVSAVAPSADINDRE